MVSPVICGREQIEGHHQSLMLPVFFSLFVPLDDAGLGHAFAQVAVFVESFFRAADLLAEKVVGHSDQADDHAGAAPGGRKDERRGLVAEVRQGPGRRRPIPGPRPVSPPGHVATTAFDDAVPRPPAFVALGQ